MVEGFRPELHTGELGVLKHEMVEVPWGQTVGEPERVKVVLQASFLFQLKPQLSLFEMSRCGKPGPAELERI